MVRTRRAGIFVIDVSWFDATCNTKLETFMTSTNYHFTFLDDSAEKIGGVEFDDFWRGLGG